MKIICLLLFTVALAFGFAGCNKNTNDAPNANTKSNNGPGPGPADPVKDTARMQYVEHCVVCHKDDGTGGRVTIGDKKIRVPSLKEGHALRHSDDEFNDQIAEGGDGMPGFKDKLTPEQIKNITTYIRQTFQGGGARK